MCYLANRDILEKKMKSSYENYIENKGYTQLKHCQRFAPQGKTYHLRSENMEGFYWVLETDCFAINIHDFLIKKDSFSQHDLSKLPQFYAFSSYTKCAQGEQLSPYQPLSPNQAHLTLNKGQTMRYLLHANSNYQSVGINFKEQMIHDYLVEQCQLNEDKIENIFQIAHPLIVKDLERIANEIVNYKLENMASTLFYEIKAKEWLSVILNAYQLSKCKHAVCPADEQALANVCNYIKDHLATQIPQDLLAQIAMMSKTKLKNCFKQQYKMTLTEFIQLQRMKQAKQLLISTNLEISDVAKSVGYQSHSRFANLFKKYMGLYPHNIRQQIMSPLSQGCQSCCNEQCQTKKLLT